MPRPFKSTRVLPVETFRASNQVLDAIHRYTDMTVECWRMAGRDVGYNRGPWKQFSIRFASSK